MPLDEPEDEDEDEDDELLPVPLLLYELPDELEDEPELLPVPVPVAELVPLLLYEPLEDVPAEPPEVVPPPRYELPVPADEVPVDVLVPLLSRVLYVDPCDEERYMLPEDDPDGRYPLEDVCPGRYVTLEL